ncbi:acetyl-CoA synthetase [Ruminococcaceae bacterium FB2012]|nr:acetyl-CoA synthetase [Ruminococcaceae bacterium FB2012]
MTLYQKYCKETFDESGRLTGFELVYPESFNFSYDVVDEYARLEPDKRALVWCDISGNEKQFTFADLKNESDRCANVLLEAGIGRGDKVLVALKKHYEYWITIIALHKIGAVIIPVTHMLTAKDYIYRIETTPIKGFVITHEGDVCERVLEAVKKTGIDCRLWTVREDREGFRNLTREMQQASPVLERRETCVSDPMMLYFTSGTTGLPKGVIHDHSYPLAHIITAKYWHHVRDNGLHFTVAETGWAKSSWGKLYGQWLAGSAVMVFDFDNFDPKMMMHILNKYEVTTFCAPPTVYRYLVRSGIPELPKLTHATTAGELLNPEVFRLFKEKTGLSLCEGYGQTETALLTANFDAETSVAGSMGKPSPQYDVRIFRADGTEAEAGEVGEVCVVPKHKGERPAGLFKSYLNNDSLFEEVWRGGVYHTGDSASRDENGCFWFSGRFDDIIKTGGYRVGPYEVENVLMEHPDVLECSVIGVPDRLRGQAIKAFIKLRSGVEASRELEKKIKEFANTRLSDYKWVRLIEFVDEMPRTVSGKIRKVDQRDN